MEYLLRMLERGDQQQAHPILFVLDEFDIFATQKQVPSCWSLGLGCPPAIERR